MKKVLIGTSGYAYKHWKERFYPKDLSSNKWLDFYSKYFKTVEINASFYHSLKKETYIKWKDTTPTDFNFFIKGHRFITGVKRLKEVSDFTNFFFDAVLELKQKLAGVLWQFPPSFKLTDETKARLEEFLSNLPKKINYAFEFRHSSWFAQDVYKILSFFHSSFVFAQSSKNIGKEEITTDFVYVRFHGPGSLYSSLYSQEQMKNWAEKIKKWRKSYNVYCYFNNDADANAIKNAKELSQMVSDK